MCLGLGIVFVVYVFTCVVMVSIVSTPSVILAGTASRLIQNDTQDKMTTRALGINVWIIKHPISLFRMNEISKQGNSPVITHTVLKSPVKCMSAHSTSHNDLPNHMVHVSYTLSSQKACRNKITHKIPALNTCLTRQSKHTSS